MSISPDLERIAREEFRHALGLEVSPQTIGQDLTAVLSKMPLPQARVFAARVSDAAMEYLVATAPAPEPEPPAPPSDVEDDEPDLRDREPEGEPEPDPTEPSPAAPDAPAPTDEPAPADAVAETTG